MIMLLAAALFLAPTYDSVSVERIVSVYDGDTIRVDVAGWPDLIGQSMPIRVKGLDTPEIRGKCPAEKQKAKEARDFARRLLAGAKTVELTEIQRGKYFRIVAYVIVDGVRFDKIMIEAGLARPYHGGSRAGWC